MNISNTMLVKSIEKNIEDLYELLKETTKDELTITQFGGVKASTGMCVIFDSAREATPYEFMIVKEFGETRGYSFNEDTDQKHGRILYYYILTNELPF